MGCRGHLEANNNTLNDWHDSTELLHLFGNERDAAEHFQRGATIDGKLLVSDGESPTVTSYDIGEDLSWNEVSRVNFGSYG